MKMNFLLPLPARQWRIMDCCLAPPRPSLIALMKPLDDAAPPAAAKIKHNDALTPPPPPFLACTMNSMIARPGPWRGMCLSRGQSSTRTRTRHCSVTALRFDLWSANWRRRRWANRRGQSRSCSYIIYWFSVDATPTPTPKLDCLAQRNL